MCQCNVRLGDIGQLLKKVTQLFIQYLNDGISHEHLNISNSKLPVLQVPVKKDLFCTVKCKTISSELNMVNQVQYILLLYL